MAARAPREEAAPDGRRMVHGETRPQIVEAKRPETRAVQVATTVSEAHEGRRADQWRPSG